MALTVALQGLPPVNEVHPLAAWLASTLGWSVTAAVADGSLGGLYAFLTWRDSRRPRIAALAGLPVLAVPVAWNQVVTAGLGWPAVHWSGVASKLAPAALIVSGLVIVVEWRLVRDLASALPGTTKERRAVALAAIMLVSMSATVVFVGTQPLDDDHAGVTQATEETWSRGGCQ